MNNQRHLYAVISDIHANYQALLAVEEDAQNVAQEERLGQPVFVCLGDVVDFGPQPNECMAWVRQRADVTVQGNHDAAAADGLHIPPIHHDINRDYWPITLWTRKALTDDHKHTIREWKPTRRAPSGLKEFTLFHASLTSEIRRIDHERQARQNLSMLPTHPAYGLFGHTHTQGYFVERRHTAFVACPDKMESGKNWQTVSVGSWKPLPNGWRKAVLNPGSVGQPRRHPLLVHLDAARDPRAAYMLLLVGPNGNSRFQFRRVAYNVEETVRQLREDVRWSENGKRHQEGNNILKDKDNAQPEGPWDPDKAYLEEVLREMPECLEELVEETLIPMLEGRSWHNAGNQPTTILGR